VENAVFIELVAPEFGSNQPAVIVRGTSVDVSRWGLRVTLAQELLVGAILQVAVQLPAGAGTLVLVGEVIWSGPIPDTGTEPGWEAGFALHNAEESDIDSWVSLVAAIEG